MADITYTVEYAKSGRSSCKRSKATIPAGAVRIGKIVPDFTDPEKTQCQWHLPGPFFEMMRKMKAASKKVEAVDDLAGFGDLRPEDQASLEALVRDYWDKTVVVTKTPAKKRPKKEAAADDDGGSGNEAAEAKPKAPKKAKAEPKAPKSPPHASDVVACAANDLRALADRLVADARADGIKMPTDDGAARVAAGAALQAAWHRDAATVDLGSCLDALEQQYKTTKGAPAVAVAVEANRALVLAFKELSSFNFEAKQTMRGISYAKVSRALATCDFEILSGKAAVQLDGVGKGSASRIDEFLGSGQMEELEGFKSGTG